MLFSDSRSEPKNQMVLTLTGYLAHSLTPHLGACRDKRSKARGRSVDLSGICLCRLSKTPTGDFGNSSAASSVSSNRSRLDLFSLGAKRARPAIGSLAMPLRRTHLGRHSKLIRTS